MTQNNTAQILGKAVGIGAVAIGVNYLITKYLIRPPKDQNIEDLRKVIQGQTIKLQQSRRRRLPQSRRQLYQSELIKWGSIKQINLTEKDGLAQQLRQMTFISCQVEKVNNLIIDLELNDFKTYPCPLLGHKIKQKKQQPYLMENWVVNPCAFVLRNCVFKAGQTIQYQKKFLRSGPRSTQFFNPKDVRADIVSLGDICPGVNTVIRQLTLVLKNNYKIQKVTGIRFSFDGYYNNQMVQLTPKILQTIHHHGGCFLGTSKSHFYPDKIINSLVDRKVNHLYLIGAYHTLVSAQKLYTQIKSRKLPIAICVILKGINKDIPIFDTSFGFQSAIEQTQRFIQAGFVAASSYPNCVTLIKVPGVSAGFLAAQACRAARNVNICLVPEFPFDIYGQSGLIRYVGERVKHRGSCKIVYSEGVQKAVRDIGVNAANEFQKEIDQGKNLDNFGNFLKRELQNEINRLKLTPNRVVLFNATQTIKSAPANSIDTKLCCQLANSSVIGLMQGKTNFVAGHFAHRSALVPIQQMLSHHYSYCLQPHDQSWQRLLAMTGQPSFINDQEQFLKVDK